MITFKKSGFTLIELVIVILILGILAAAAIPKFVDLSQKAKVASDEAVIGGLKSAINIQYAQNALNGIKPDGIHYWPIDNPFTLLAQGPPNRNWTTSTPDGVTWQLTPMGGAWYLMCPHYSGDRYCNGATKGRFYIYQYGDTSYEDSHGVLHSAGELFLYWSSSDET